MKKIEKSIELEGRKLTLSTGSLANQAGGAVMASYGETVVLATVVAAKPREDLDYFPLSVDYQERLYAGGRIKGSRWVKREGRPTDEEILISRLIDRSIRPLFPKQYKNEVQVIITVLSVDLENSPEIIACIATSAALAISSIPWMGPVAVVRVGLKDKKYLINPTQAELQNSDLDLIVSLSKDSIVMIESGSSKVSEDDIISGIRQAQNHAQKIVDLIEEFSKEVGNKKNGVKEESYPQELVKQIKEAVEDKLADVVLSMAKLEGGRSGDYQELLDAVAGRLNDEEKKYVPEIVEEIKKKYIRSLIFKGKRIDGRGHDEVRPLSAGVGMLPRTHGSAIFERGQTQVLTVTTLGAPSLEQFLESAEGEETKRYIHHYSMPPFSTGEVGRIGSPSRREIGHGALAERALLPVIPSEDVFPYTIRVVSETLSSNGSTSMASTCGSTLSLMDAGVPVTAPVAGIAMGLVIEDSENYAILTDINGLEDFNGDMDFKVAGTKDGITALQLDVKTLSLNLSILEKALGQAKKARLEVLSLMETVIAKPRESVSKYAPKIKIIRIDPEKIGELIGPGGKTIKRIIKETGAQIDVDDTGDVFVSGTTLDELNAAISQVEAIVKEPQPGEIYDGIVKRLMPFGAFVEISPGKEGLVHVSDMSMDFVKDPGDIVEMGQRVQVRVKEIDEMGRINLSMLLSGDKEKRREGEGRRPFMPFSRSRDRFRRPRSSGPHFPTSRFLDEKKNFPR